MSRTSSTQSSKGALLDLWTSVRVLWGEWGWLQERQKTDARDRYGRLQAITTPARVHFSQPFILQCRGKQSQQKQTCWNLHKTFILTHTQIPVPSTKVNRILSLKCTSSYRSMPQKGRKSANWPDLPWLYLASRLSPSPLLLPPPLSPGQLWQLCVTVLGTCVLTATWAWG